MKIFVLNLERHVERREEIARQLNSRGLDFEIISGVDGRQLSAAEVSTVYSSARAQKFLGRQLTMGEIGCAMSHCKALARVVNDHWVKNGWPDRLVMSFHGLPFDASTETGGVDKVRWWRDTVKIDAAAK